jgi:hypothetical protein
LFDARFESVQRGKHTGQIPGARTLFVGLIDLNGIVAEINDFVTNRLKPLDEPGGP